MNIEFVARDYQLGDQVRAHAKDKLRKVTKFLQEPVEIRVTLDTEKHRQIADLHVAHRFGVLQAREDTDSMLDSINQAVEKVEKQARRSRKKFMARRRRADRQNGHQWPVEVVERESLETGRSPRIVKSSVLHIKPMSIDEAALELESSRNDFLVFLDAESHSISVLYKRKDKNYGLISPEF